MSAPTYILGGFQTDFAQAWARNGLDIADMVREATLGALHASHLEPESVQSIHVGNAFGELQRQQAHLGSLVAQVVPALWGVPAMRHEGACASSSLAILTAMAEIEAGRYECVLVLGVEEFKNTAGDVASVNQNAAAWQGREGIDCKFMWPAAFGLLAQAYEARYGTPHAQLRSSLNRIAELNYGHAKKNPLAQTRKWQFNDSSFTDDDEANPIIEPGTRRQDCGQITDGACALLLASPRFAQDHAKRTGLSLTDLPRITGWGHHNAGLRFKDKLARSAGGTGHIFPHVRDTITDAWARAGLDRTQGIKHIDGIETHDCFTTTEYMAIDHFGLTAPGQSWQAVEEGRIEVGGKATANGPAVPFNLSGGLIGCGHPVGATGARMVWDAARQVSASAGDAQIEGAKRMQTLNIGGSCATVVSFVVEG